MSNTQFTPEISRSRRENMRLFIYVILLRYMHSQKSNKVKLVDFKKWLSAEYLKSDSIVREAQECYEEYGFTGKGTSHWYGGPYMFWSYDRLDRWLSKIEDISFSKENNRWMLTQNLVDYVG